MARCARRFLGPTAIVASLSGAACLPDNPAIGDDATTATTPGDDDGPVQVGGAVLGCGGDAQTCNLLLVSETLDDRIEIFAPDDPDGVVYRGAIDLDLKPNECAGCGLGDIGGGRLDEPYGLALAGGFVHVVAGHYPSPEQGTLVSFPLELFADATVGDTLGVGSYFAGGAFSSGVVATPLEQLEPTFVSVVGDRLVIGTFANNLFSTEDSWTLPGKLLVLDPADPAGGIGVAELGDLDGGPCNGASEVVALEPGRLAVACDGNEAVAILDTPDLADAAPGDGAASITGTLCPIPGAQLKRVRHLAPDGEGGFVVAEGPGSGDLLAAARVWHFDGACTMLGLATLPSDSDWQLGQIVRWPAAPRTWLLATGSIADGPRGVYVLRADPDLQVCGMLPGLDAFLADGSGDALEPFGLAVAEDGSGVAIGIGPFVPPSAGPGQGKVVWARLAAGDDPCAPQTDAVDLTAGGGTAPAVDPTDPDTFRRAPNVLTIARVQG